MKRIAKNSSVYLMGNIISKLISFVVIIYLAKYLGIMEFGKYTLVFTYLAFFGIISDPGLNPILVREMSRDDSMSSKLVGNVYIMKIILTSFAIGFALITLQIMKYPPDIVSYIYVASFTWIFISFSFPSTAIFQANLKMEYSIITDLAYKIISAILILGVIYSKGTLMHIIIIMVFSEMIRTSINYYLSKNIVRADFKIDLKLWKYLIKEGTPLGISNVFWVFFFQIDILMLYYFQGDVSVGIYSAAHKLYDPLIILPNALIISLFPLMSMYFKSSKNSLIKTYEVGIKYMIIFTLLIVILIGLMAENIIILIYGSSFINSAIVLKILILTFTFASMNLLLMTLLTSIDKQRLNALNWGICMIINIILNIIMIPKFSYIGASISTVISEIFLFIFSFYFVSNYLHAKNIVKIFMKPLISGLIVSAFIIYFKNMDLLVLIIFSTILYLITLMILNTFSEEDYTLFKKIIDKN